MVCSADKYKYKESEIMAPCKITIKGKIDIIYEYLRRKDPAIFIELENLIYENKWVEHGSEGVEQIGSVIQELPMTRQLQKESK